MEVLLKQMLFPFTVIFIICTSLSIFTSFTFHELSWSGGKPNPVGIITSSDTILMLLFNPHSFEVIFQYQYGTFST